MTVVEFLLPGHPSSNLYALLQVLSTCWVSLSRQVTPPALHNEWGVLKVLPPGAYTFRFPRSGCGLGRKTSPFPPPAGGSVCSSGWQLRPCALIVSSHKMGLVTLGTLAEPALWSVRLWSNSGAHSTHLLGVIVRIQPLYIRWEAAIGRALSQELGFSQG